MNYEETLSFMYSQLPMYQRIGKAAYKADLKNTIALLEELGNPQNSFKCIHLAGTNGKGSTSHLIASVFQEAGYKTGLYTSPHLIDFRERIRINGKMIEKEEVVNFIANSKEQIASIKPSFFELTVALAFHYFEKEEVDIAIIETGLGGRLDSTNVVRPELSIITNIGLDHTQFLGDSLESIAREKAGIIKEGIPVIVGESRAELKRIFKELADSKSSPLIFTDDFQEAIPKSELLGNYQRKNEKTAYMALSKLRKSNWNISDDKIKIGFKKVVSNTGLAGRYQVLESDPKIICDTAHNKEGLSEVLDQLKSEKYKQLHLVLGFVEDKSIDSILPLFPNGEKYYLCQSSVPRSLPISILEEKVKGFGFSYKAFDTVIVAFKNALKSAEKNDLIYVGGSTFVVADLLTYLQSNPLR